MKKLFWLSLIFATQVSAQNLIVKKHLPLTVEEIKNAQIYVWLPQEEQVPFDDSYAARMQAYRENRSRSRMINGARSSGGMATPLMIPLVWGTFD